ncbi:MAG: hypothetical protein AAF787_16510, partial [Chloroflexota bacterium]
VTAPAWSPDGTRIAAGCDGTLCLINPDGSGLTLLASRGGRPAWSPSGESIAFVCPGTGLDTVCIISRNGINVFAVTDELGQVVNTPQWSSDGRRLAFDLITGDEPTATLYVLNIISNRQQAVAQVSTTDNNGFFGISWQPQ